MDNQDEPLQDPDAAKIRIATSRENDPQDGIRTLLGDYRFGVLCTQGNGHPYGSLVAFAYNDDLSGIAFCTPTETRKYRLLSECNRVAFVVDSRTSHPDGLIEVNAVTATGRATELSPGTERRSWSELLISRHPILRPFLDASTTALFYIAVEKYFLVARFQEVMEWTPPVAP